MTKARRSGMHCLRCKRPILRGAQFALTRERTALCRDCSAEVAREPRRPAR